MMLALVFVLFAVPDPSLTVQELFTRAAGGDLAAARELWPDARPERRVETRCLRIADLALDVVSAGADDAIVETRETLAVEGVRLERSHSRFVLRREGERWRVVSSESREQTLVDRLADADAASRAQLLAGSEPLQTETFVRLLSRRVVDRVNENRLNDAKALIEIAVRVAERLGDPAALSEALSARSVVARYARPRDLDLAADLVRQAIELAESSESADALAAALLRHVRLQEELTGHRDPAPLERAMTLAERVEHAPTLSHIATHLFRAYEQSGRGREAFRNAELASRYAEISGDVAARISASIVLSGAYLWFGDDDLAMPHIRRAAELSLASGFSNGAALSFSTMANALLARGEYDEALRVLEEPIATITAAGGLAMLLRCRAGVHIHRGDFELAERDLMRSAEVAPLDGTSRHEFEQTLAVIRLRQQRYEEAIALATRTGDTGIVAHSLRCLGRDDEALALLSAGPHGFSDTIWALDPPRMLFQATPRNELLLTMLVERGRIFEAFEIVEHLAAETLRLSVAKGRIDDVLYAWPADRRRAAELDGRVAALNRAFVAEANTEKRELLRQQLADARVELLDFRQRVHVREASVPPRTPSFSDMADLPAHLDPVTIVSYLPASDSTIIFVNGPKRDGRRKLTAYLAPIDKHELTRQVVRFADALDQRNLRVNELGAGLYDLLLRPIEAEIRGARMICIVPDRILWRVPFHALAPKRGTMLADRLPVFYVPSVAVLALTESRRRPRDASQPPTLLAFANPRMSEAATALYRSFDRDLPLGNLAEAEREVRTIAKFYGRSTVHIGDDARETTLKREAPRYDVLHLATHGLVHDHAPMFSSLVLSPDGNTDDGLLEAREIAMLDLDADLAVLSACETGKAGGSGVVALSWALLAAGCPTTVVSQWNAHSDATAKLMVEFHRHLVAGASKPEALRRAQRTLRRNPRYAHPFYWAPFVVIGSP